MLKAGRGLKQEGAGQECGRSLHLCEGKPRLVVDLEDLLDGVDVRGRPQVQTQVVLAGRAHDLLKKQRDHVALVTASRHTGPQEVDLRLTRADRSMV